MDWALPRKASLPASLFGSCSRSTRLRPISAISRSMRVARRTTGSREELTSDYAWPDPLRRYALRGCLAAYPWREAQAGTSMARNVFLTDLRGFANPAIAAHLAKAGARIIACDPAIRADGEEGGVDMVGWDTPAVLVAKAVQRFGGKLDGILISPAMP